MPHQHCSVLRLLRAIENPIAFQATIVNLPFTIESEKGVTMTEVDARQSVSFVLAHFTRRGEQVEVVSNEQVVGEICFEGICRPVSARRILIY